MTIHQQVLQFAQIVFSYYPNDVGNKILCILVLLLLTSTFY